MKYDLSQLSQDEIRHLLDSQPSPELAQAIHETLGPIRFKRFKSLCELLEEVMKIGV